MASSSTWIETYSGRRFYILDPRPIDVSIDDISHALSLIARFTGHTREFYSVAQHSVLVSRTCDAKDALWGLLHDGSEAYLSDVSTPLKHSSEMARYRTAERHVQAAVAEHFKLSPKEPESVKLADKRLLVTEKRDLMAPSPDWEAFAEIEPLPGKIFPWSHQRAKAEFLERFYELTRPATTYAALYTGAVTQADGYVDHEADVHGN